MPIITRVSFSSFWKWVVLLQALKEMGNATPYANKKWVACSDNKTVFNNHETHNTRGHYYKDVSSCEVWRSSL